MTTGNLIENLGSLAVDLMMDSDSDIRVAVEAATARVREVIHTCSCKREFGLLQWLLLPFIGFNRIDAVCCGDILLSPEENFEMRNCACGTTMTVYATKIPARWRGRMLRIR